MRITIKHSESETGLVRRICCTLEVMFPSLPYKQTRDLPNGLTEVYYKYSEDHKKHP